MIRNAVFATLMIFAGIAGFLLSELSFLSPYKALIIRQHGTAIVCSGFVVLLNVFAGVYALYRKFLLKDTGRKLQHVDKDLKLRHGVPVHVYEEGRS